MTTPKRIQLRRTKGWRKPAGAVVVARPSAFGNPFRVSHWEWRMDDVSPYWSCVAVSRAVVQRFHSKEEATAKAVEMFRAMLSLTGQDRLDFLREWSVPAAVGAMDLEALRGKDLACWCPLGAPCHADVLLELANREVPG